MAAVRVNVEDSGVEPAETAERLRRISPQHPALARLRERLLAGVGGWTKITSYDRMHHRHNRS